MKTIFTLIIFLFLFFSLRAQPGIPDPTFANNGILIEKSYPGSLVHIAPESNGKFIAAGVGSDNNGFLLIQYNQTGIIDSSFGDNGAVITAFPTSDGSYCTAVGIDVSGKIVAAGTISRGGNISVGLARYNNDGGPDKSFGSDGLVNFIVGDESNVYTQSIAMQPDEKIVISGYSNQGSNGNYKPIIFRFNSDGTIDKSFGNNGEVVTNQNSPANFPCVILQDDGKILAGGSSSKFMLFRYLSDGTPDSTFGINGVARQAFSNNAFGQLNCMLLQRNGYVICGGEAIPAGGTGAMGFLRFTDKGFIDSTFGTMGQVITTFNDESSASKALIQNDGKFLGVGNLISLNDPSKFITVRYTPDGKIDSTFGAQGSTVTVIQDAATCYDAALQKDSKILLAGISVLSSTNETDFSFARYDNNDESKKQILITKIKRWIQHHNGIEWTNTPGAQSYAVQRSSDGQHWATINRQAAVNDQQSAVNHYSDPTPSSTNTTYYRLQTTSNSNAVANSNVITITNNELDVSLSPNPAKSTLSIAGLPTNEKVKITVVDFSGNFKLQTTVNSSLYTLNIASLPAGNYVLKAETSTNSVSKQFVKE